MSLTYLRGQILRECAKCHMAKDVTYDMQAQYAPAWICEDCQDEIETLHSLKEWKRAGELAVDRAWEINRC